MHFIRLHISIMNYIVFKELLFRFLNVIHQWNWTNIVGRKVQVVLHLVVVLRYFDTRISKHFTDSITKSVIRLRHCCGGLVQDERDVWTAAAERSKSPRKRRTNGVPRLFRVHECSVIDRFRLGDARATAVWSTRARSSHLSTALQGSGLPVPSHTYARVIIDGSAAVIVRLCHGAKHAVAKQLKPRCRRNTWVTRDSQIMISLQL